MTTKIQRSKDPKIQKGDNHHSRVRFSFHFHYLKTKNPDREKTDVKLKMARTSLVIKSVTSPNQKMPPPDQRTIQLNIIAAAPFRYKHIGPPFDLLLLSEILITRRVDVAGVKVQKLAAAGEPESDQDGVGADATKNQPAVQ